MDEETISRNFEGKKQSHSVKSEVLSNLIFGFKSDFRTDRLTKNLENRDLLIFSLDHRF